MSVLMSVLVLLVAYPLVGDYLVPHIPFALSWILGSVVGSLVLFELLKTHAIIIRYTNFKHIVKFGLACIGKALVMLVALLLFAHLDGYVILMLVFDFLLTLLMLTGVRVAMIVVYDFYRSRMRNMQNCRRVLVYGTSDKSESAVLRFGNSPHYEIMGIITPNKDLRGTRFADKPVYVFEKEEDVESVSLRLSCSAILFTRRVDTRTEADRLVQYCSALGLKVLMVPEVGELSEEHSLNVRDVKVEDLLGRDEIRISVSEIRKAATGRVIMVTGAAGSIGSELCRQLATFGARKLIFFDNAETPMHNLRLEFDESFPDVEYVPVIGDVRHPERLDFAFRTYHPEFVFHAAAYKHVPLMEENPCEAVRVNFIGTRNVADKCIQYDVKKMVMVSTDKAVNPTNIMGCSKRLAEIYVQSLGLAVESGEVKGRTKFVTTRFGNVLGSNGSVIPRFRDQIEHGGPVTVTHPDITRFFMTIPEACRLVMEAAILDTSNRICVFDMGEPVKINDLARRMIELSGLAVGKDIKIEYSGLRPGEKLYEEVLSTVENTEPTQHDRIRIANVRKYSYDEVLKVVAELEDLSTRVLIPEMVIKMKQVVPEFISKNSKYSEYDAK